jgi:hypothetical protein
LVRYPISSANGVQKLDGEAQAFITASPLSPSKQLGNSVNRGILGNTYGDYLTNSWPADALRHQGKFFEFKVTAQNGFEVEYDRLELTLYSLKDKKTQNSTGPRFWELRASVDVGGMWSGGLNANIFSGTNPVDSSVQLALIDMNNYSGPTAKIEVTNVNSILGKIRTGKTTSFRLYGYAATEGEGGLYNLWNRGTDLLIYGTLNPLDRCDGLTWGSSDYTPIISPIPEPKHTTLVFAGMAALLGIFLRRRR